METWLLLLIAYLPFQTALNPGPFFEKFGLILGRGFDLASLRVLIIIFFFIWLIKKLARKELFSPFFFKNLQGGCLIAFLILAGISLIGAENIFWGVRKIFFFLSIFPFYFLILGITSHWVQIKKMLSALIFGSGIVALIGLFQFLAPFIFGLDQIYRFWAINIVPIFSGFNFGAMILAFPSWLVNINDQIILRAFSIFSDPHMFSFYSGLILPLGIGSALLQRTKQKQLILFVLSFLLYLACLLSFARGAYAAIAVTFLVLAWLFWKYLRKKGAALFLCLSLLVFILPVSPIAERFYSSFDLDEGSNVGRLEMWQQAGQTGLNYFWQGVGLGNYSLVVDADFGYRNPITAHNLYLDFFSEGGFLILSVWLILILGTLGQLLKKLIQIKQSNQERGCLLIALIGSLVYFSVHSFFETSIYNPVILAVLMIVLGLATVMTKLEINN